MGWFDKDDKPKKARKFHLIRSADGRLIANVSTDALAAILNGIKDDDIAVDSGRYVFLSDDGFKYGNNTHAIYLWRGTTIDCIPTDVS